MKTSISELLEMQKKLYAQAYENIILRRLEKEHLFHDMKNHLLAIHRMAKDGQTQRLESYVDKLYESFGSAREYTGNRLVDYLISEKSDRARRQGNCRHPYGEQLPCLGQTTKESHSLFISC